MKKVIITLALAAIAVSANAQVFVGGELGLNTKATKIEGEKTDASTTFTFAPEFGYQLEDNFLVGIRLGISPASQSTFIGNTETKQKTFGWDINPYARYKFLEFGNFGIWAEGGLGIGGSKIDDNTSLFAFTVGIKPVVSYAINEHFTLLSSLNCFGLNFITATTTTKIGDDTSKATVNSFDFGVNGNKVVNTLGGITLGVVYTF